MNFHSFSDTNNFLQALKELFNDLKVPMNYVADEPTTAAEILKDTYKDNEAFHLMDDVYFAGMVDDAAFEGNKSLEAAKIKSDYDGILIFGVTLKQRRNGLLPTRSQLAEISRAFNREFYYTPVVVVFKYGNHLAFANTERLKYKQEWREGEKAGKVSLLRDINIQKPHSGHERILAELQIPTAGARKVDSFAKLYSYWQEVFSVSLLNKKFYQELSTWYFWATQHVTFPGELTITDAHRKNAKLEELLQEHRATNIIRLLTRLLFVWFVKEKKLIPEELFDLDTLQEKFLHKISPWREGGLFPEANMESIYYKAILQNLFFATLNCPIEGDKLDKRTRGFRGDGFGTHRGIDYLMRYKQYFKNPDAFLEQLNSVVPFLNGGLFECLDDKFNQIYIDGFSDKMANDEQLIVPDYLFFGLEEQTDISGIIGIKDKKYKRAAVKGLINILKSYKFTITENTPIEEDVALDPELLGKVFENLLASYNPETKTTARKQTGSFYTPREIVNYMVDESLIAYLKNAIKDWVGLDDETLDKQLHVLTSFDSKVPFADNPGLQQEIITALSTCTILDPACGSGAFPMGILQKMVHILQKLDPDNKLWKEVQLKKARKESEAAFEIEDKQAREERLIEINEAFDQSINDPDYARKLFLIENCIYGVDIQPIATQISKLRFFISLVVEQKVNPEKENYGIRPLPNLETKFVAANTLIGIKKDGGLFETDEVKKLENELKIVRHKIFSLKSKERKIAWREKDKELREKLSEFLKNQGLPLDAAEKLAKWDPYDQNSSSPFFDSEWMFGIKEGFDVVIGNPPYRSIQKYAVEIKKDWSKQGFKTYSNSGNIYFLFYEKGLNITSLGGSVMFITSNQWMRNISGEPLRKLFLSKYCPEILIDFRGTDIFENVAVLSNILMISNKDCNKPLIACDVSTVKKKYHDGLHHIVNEHSIRLNSLSKESWLIFDKVKHNLREHVIKSGTPISKWNLEIYRGILTGYNDAFYLNKEQKDNFLKIDPKNNTIIRPMLRGKDLARYAPNPVEVWLINTHNGKYRGRGLERDGRINVINEYPSIYRHLLSFQTDLEKRQDKGDHWTNLRSCDYVEAFDSPKMIFMNMSKDLIFSYDPKGEFLTNQKCFIVTGESIRYLTAFFNSKLFRYFFKDNFPELLGDVREVSKVYFEKIPVKRPETKTSLNTIENMVEFIVHLKTHDIKLLSNLEQIIEGLIIEIYFPDHMKERGIDVLEFVERDIKQVMQGREFEKLSDAEKEQVIEALHAKWSNPDNEVVKRMAMFKEKSPDILKPIIES